MTLGRRFSTPSGIGHINWGILDAFDGISRLTVNYNQRPKFSDGVPLASIIDCFLGSAGWGIFNFLSGANLFIVLRKSSLGSASTSSGPIVDGKNQNVHFSYNGNEVVEADRLALWVDAIPVPLTVNPPIPTSLASTNLFPLLYGANAANSAKWGGVLGDVYIWVNAVIRDVNLIKAIAKGRGRRLFHSDLQIVTPLWGIHDPEIDLSEIGPSETGRTGTLTTLKARAADHFPTSPFMFGGRQFEDDPFELREPCVDEKDLYVPGSQAADLFHFNEKQQLFVPGDEAARVCK